MKTKNQCRELVRNVLAAHDAQTFENVDAVVNTVKADRRVQAAAQDEANAKLIQEMVELWYQLSTMIDDSEFYQNF